MEEELKKLGPMNKKEFRTLLILLFIVGLWITEPIHGLHPTITVIIGVVLMSLPKIGCARWKKVVEINYNTVILLSVTLSMGYGLIESRAVLTISEYLSVDWLLTLMQNPIVAVIIIIVLTQIFHKLISNVSTAVVTLVPIFINIGFNASINPMILGFAAGLTSLFGFIFVVETMPNLLVHSTGMIAQRDFLRVGFHATVVTTIATIFISTTWWKVLGIV